MSLCEHDRNILNEIRSLLTDIKHNQIRELEWCKDKNNNIARINQEVLEYHLKLMKDKNEDIDYE